MRSAFSSPSLRSAVSSKLPEPEPEPPLTRSTEEWLNKLSSVSFSRGRRPSFSSRVAPSMAISATIASSYS